MGQITLSSITSITKSRTTLFVVGALALGALGVKMFMPETPKLQMPVASAKSAVKATPKTNAKTQAGQTARTNSIKPLRATESVAREHTARTTANPEPVAPPPAPIPVAPRRVVPDDVDGSSDTEGLFLISALNDGRGNEPATQPVTPTVVTLGEPASNALNERVVTTAAKKAAATEGLGPVFVDESNGYHMRFPAGWSIRRFDGQPWVVECGDGHNALLNVGFSAFPSEYTAENISLDWVARRTKKRSDTVLNAQGYATIMGKRALWSKSTGPMQIGSGQVKVVRTTYILPLGDGRVAEIRIAAAPEQFEKVAGVMKNSVSTFRLIAAKAADTTVAHTE